MQRIRILSLLVTLTGCGGGEAAQTSASTRAAAAGAPSEAATDIPSEPITPLEPAPAADRPVDSSSAEPVAVSGEPSGGAGGSSAEATGGESNAGGSAGAEDTDDFVMDPGTEGNGQHYQPPPYEYTEDSMQQAGVPEGSVTSFDHNDSAIFPGTERQFHVYEPAQYNPDQPAALLVVQDGQTSWAYWKGAYRTTVVLDNLIHKGDIPVTIAVFVDNSSSDDPNKDRSFEYDTIHDLYGRFILEEILPRVKEQWNVIDHPEGHAAMGVSSGGIASFTMGWFFPDDFRRLLIHSGSFVDTRGGDQYKNIVAESEVKPLRIYMQDGNDDYVRPEKGWDWPKENKALADVLEDKGYDYRFVNGEDGHNGMHGVVDLPDALRWLWRGYPR